MWQIRNTRERGKRRSKKRKYWVFALLEHKKNKIKKERNNFINCVCFLISPYLMMKPSCLFVSLLPAKTHKFIWHSHNLLNPTSFLPLTFFFLVLSLPPNICFFTCSLFSCASSLASVIITAANKEINESPWVTCVKVFVCLHIQYPTAYKDMSAHTIKIKKPVFSWRKTKIGENEYLYIEILMYLYLF